MAFGPGLLGVLDLLYFKVSHFVVLADFLPYHVVFLFQTPVCYAAYVHRLCAGVS